MQLRFTRAHPKSGVNVEKNLLPSENSSAYSEHAGDGEKSRIIRAAAMRKLPDGSWCSYRPPPILTGQRRRRAHPLSRQAAVRLDLEPLNICHLAQLTV